MQLYRKESEEFEVKQEQWVGWNGWSPAIWLYVQFYCCLVMYVVYYLL